MNYASLRSPGVVNGGFRLRLDCAKAISAVEIVSKTGPAGITTAQGLRDFFIACANAADVAAGGSGTAVVSGGIVLAANQAVITDGASVIVNDNAGTANAKSPGVATVSGGALQKVTLAA